MAEMVSERSFTDKEGNKVERRLVGGIIETSLPADGESEWYISNVIKPMQEESRQREQHFKKEIKIQQKIRKLAEESMQKYQCSVCDYIYDPDLGDPESSFGILPGTPFRHLPNSWTCPSCGADKAKFKKYEE